MPRKKVNRHLSPRDQLLITAYLEHHRDRASKGLSTAMVAMESNPVNQQFQGMGDHFCKLISLINDMIASLGHKQNWLPYFEAAVDQLEIET